MLLQGNAAHDSQGLFALLVCTGIRGPAIAFKAQEHCSLRISSFFELLQLLVNCGKMKQATFEQQN